MLGENGIQQRGSEETNLLDAGNRSESQFRVK
jgi:hypothetical protein